MANGATKACNLTEEEIRALIAFHGHTFSETDEISDSVERINYLHKRLKSFNDPAEKAEPMPMGNANPAGWA